MNVPYKMRVYTVRSTLTHSYASHVYSPCIFWSLTYYLYHLGTLRWNVRNGESIVVSLSVCPFIFPIFLLLRLCLSFISFNALFSPFHHSRTHLYCIHTQTQAKVHAHTHGTAICRLENHSCQYAGNVVCVSDYLPTQTISY